jgi:hypothetical protein
LDDTDRPFADEQRNEEGSAHTHAPGELAVDFGVFDERVEPLAPAPVEHAPALRRLAVQPHSEELFCLLAVGGLDAERVDT